MRCRQEFTDASLSDSKAGKERQMQEPPGSHSAEDRLLTDRDVYSLTGLDRVTLYRLRNAGKIGFYKFGKVIRYSVAQLREFLAQHERQPRSRRQRTSR